MYVSATSTRLSRGMSTPARRAMLASPGDVWRCGAHPVPGPPTRGVPRVPIEERSAGSGRANYVFSCGTASCLALALLVARVALADDHDAAVATDHLAVVADRLDARVDLHDVAFFSLSSCTPRMRWPLLVQATYL